MKVYPIQNTTVSKPSGEAHKPNQKTFKGELLLQEIHNSRNPKTIKHWIYNFSKMITAASKDKDITILRYGQR